VHPILLFFLILVIGTMAWGCLLAAPWVPTLKKQRNLLVENLVIDETSIIYDLGCGSGSILFAFADRYPRAQCIGYDVALLPLCIGTIIKVVYWKKYRNVHLRFGNFFKKDVSDANVVVAFLMKNVYDKFFTQLQSNLKPGTLIVVEAWPHEKLTPAQIITGENLVPWYVYNVKA
jgi:trans-aconitate methyltransferase